MEFYTVLFHRNKRLIFQAEFQFLMKGGNTCVTFINLQGKEHKYRLILIK